jgi:predicted DCC family thiol-disulfide oxidoreductase YuxK
MGGPEIVFYDGGCGLCHGFVRFAVARDRAARFRFSPLQGREIRRRLSAEVIRTLPDAVVFLDGSGDVHVKSDAALRVIGQLGPGWRTVAGIGRIVPRFLRDPVYDFVAGVRHRLFRSPAEACPLVPAELRDRFLD